MATEHGGCRRTAWPTEPSNSRRIGPIPREPITRREAPGTGTFAPTCASFSVPGRIRLGPGDRTVNKAGC